LGQGNNYFASGDCFTAPALQLAMHWQLALATLVLLSVAFAQPPATPKKPVTDTYHGIKVVDNYRWLEDWSTAEVRDWSEAQNRYARQYLDRLPQRARLYDELKQLYTKPSASYSELTQVRQGPLFAMRKLPPKEQPALVVMKSAMDPDSARVVLDPTQFDATGHTAIDFYVPSPDDKLVAVSLSKGGSESGDVYILDVATGKQLADIVPRVNGGTAGGAVAWKGDGSGFYYTRYPRAGERPEADLDFYQQIWFHRLGTATKSDTYSLGKDFPRIAEITMQSSQDGRYVVARMANGDGGEFAFYLLGPDGQWKQVSHLSDDIIDAQFGRDAFLYLLSKSNAPMRKIIRVPLANPNLAGAQTLVPESKAAIEQFAVTNRFIYVADMIGGPSELRIFDLTGHPAGIVPLPPVTSVLQMEPHGISDDLLFETMSFVQPRSWSTYSAERKAVSVTKLVAPAPADYSDVEVLREFATSRDGTKVPLNIIRKKGTKRNGENPVLLTAYGGYSISLRPSFSPRVRVLLDHGFVFVVANLRGGAEYGEAWHRAGNLTNKQNVFDDFAASARYLMDQHYTTSSKLAIEGGSNGGLLMGAAFTQHPELYRAVVSHVGIYDMLRVELSPNGAFNVTEFGTVKEQEQFKALYAYSPYHHVKDGVQYPGILFMTGANDPRVDPMNSRKMTARLQATGTKLPVLLRTSSTTGHGIGSSLSERIGEDADALAFILAQLAIE
jgi:prolyl oligopeptidase